MYWKLTREPRRMSTGKFRPHLPLHDRMQDIKRNASLDMSRSLLEVMQLSQFPVTQQQRSTTLSTNFRSD